MEIGLTRTYVLHPGDMHCRERSVRACDKRAKKRTVIWLHPCSFIIGVLQPEASQSARGRVSSSLHTRTVFPATLGHEVVELRGPIARMLRPDNGRVYPLLTRLTPSIRAPRQRAGNDLAFLVLGTVDEDGLLTSGDMSLRQLRFQWKGLAYPRQCRSVDMEDNCISS